MKQNLTHKGLTRLYFIMRVTAIYFILLYTVCLELLQAKSVNGQGIKDTYVTIRMEHKPLAAILENLEDQTSFLFVYPPEILNKYTDVSVNKRNSSLEEVLNDILQNLPLTYGLSKKNIAIRYENRPHKDVLADLNKTSSPMMIVRGTVTESSTGVAMPGVSILIKGTASGTTTDSNGRFSIDVASDDVLTISSVGYKNQEVNVAGRSIIDVQMEDDISSLKEVVINGGYYTTNVETKVGNIVSVSGDDIKDQPLTSPLMGLQGRAAGVDVYPTSGVPGASTGIRIRGRSSLRFDGGYPLYVIDGVPVESRPVPSSSILVDQEYDPLSSINPADIESIAILKDADATAIYGSRGANGVVLITTRKAKAGQTSVDFNVYRGVGQISKKMDLLKTKDYLSMRREAFRNNGNEVMTEFTAPDFLVWDTTRYTDWQDALMGQTSNITDLQGSIAGGTASTSFRFGVGYHKETTIFPGDFNFERLTGSFSLNHLSSNQKFRVLISANYGRTRNHIFDSDVPISLSYTLPPNAPNLYNDDGSLNWAHNSYGWDTWTNPMSDFERTNDLISGNLMFNSTLSYSIGGGLLIKANLGYTDLNSSEILKTPLSSYSPANAPYYTPESQWTNTQRQSWITEPQLVFNKRIGSHGLDAILGMTLQEGNSNMKNVFASGYSSDALLGSLSGASSITINGDENLKYRYTAVFARLEYDFEEKYFANFTARRDGSSRFGQNNRFGNFGSFGAAWIFSKERLIANLSFLSRGKLRGSFGTTGNDQIGDYRYINTYQNTVLKYQGAYGLLPSNLFNPDFKWEVSKKLEGALELSFLNNRVDVEIAWYRNRSSNLLIEYQLPGTTGFGSVLKNLDAVVENRGWEYTINAEVLRKGDFYWSLSANYSRPRNELVRFDNLEQSTYANMFIVGQPLDVKRLYKFTGVDSETGMYTYLDVDDSGSLDATDRIIRKNVGRTSFGGMGSMMSFKGIELSMQFQFVKQISNKLMPTSMPGQMANLPAIWYANRWQRNGDIAKEQKVSTGFDGFSAFYDSFSSDLSVESSSFLRLKTLSLSYSFPSGLLSRLKTRECRLYIQGQNIFTVTNFSGIDPETGNYNIPPLRIIILGLKVGI